MEFWCWWLMHKPPGICKPYFVCILNRTNNKDWLTQPGIGEPMPHTDAGRPEPICLSWKTMSRFSSTVITKFHKGFKLPQAARLRRAIFVPIFNRTNSKHWLSCQVQESLSYIGTCAERAEVICPLWKMMVQFSSTIITKFCKGFKMLTQHIYYIYRDTNHWKWYTWGFG